LPKKSGLYFELLRIPDFWKDLGVLVGDKTLDRRLVYRAFSLAVIIHWTARQAKVAQRRRLRPTNAAPPSPAMKDQSSGGVRIGYGSGGCIRLRVWLLVVRPRWARLRVE
jgi:hypothetical protein